MLIYIILILICWIICLAISIAIYPRLNGNCPMWKKLGITILLSFTLPFVIIVGLIKDLFGKKKPKPVNMDILSLMKYNTVKDGKNYVTLPEYNELHGTSFTLADVYGEDYADKHYFEEHKDDFDYKPKTPGTLGMPFKLENTPSELACEALGNAIVHGMFDEFSDMLAEDAETILYKSKTIAGKDNVINYWKGWKKKYFDNGQIKDPRLIDSEYNGDIALSLDTMLVYAFVNDKKIKKLLLISHHISPMIGFMDDMTQKPFDLYTIKNELEPLTEENKTALNETCENRIPCLSCGEKSDSLKWYLHNVEAGSVGYRSTVSVCPHCNKVVEYNSIIRYRF